MSYNVTITFKGEDFTVTYDNLDEVYQAVNNLGGYYGNDNLVAVSDDPFIAVKFKDIDKLSITGISRTALRKYAAEKVVKLQAEKMAAYEAQVIQGNSLGSAQGLNFSLCAESSGARLI